MNKLVAVQPHEVPNFRSHAAADRFWNEHTHGEVRAWEPFDLVQAVRHAKRVEKSKAPHARAVARTSKRGQ